MIIGEINKRLEGQLATNTYQLLVIGGSLDHFESQIRCEILPYLARTLDGLENGLIETLQLF